MSSLRVVVAGGGAAGFFGAIACAEANPKAEVILLEKSPELLAKVTISGGGRCNVTHHCFDVNRLVQSYPRGGRELIGPFHRWQPRDTVEWFESRGVPLKIEPDGRMFPVTDRSASIVDCLVAAARKTGVRIRTSCGLASFAKRRIAAQGSGSYSSEGQGPFQLHLTTRETMECDRLLIASGGNKNTAGYSFAASVGHTIEPPVPSLFTFNIVDPRLEGLAGLSVPDGVVSAPALKLKQGGPVLITHWGLSGPAVLKLSAWGARVFADCGYEFDLQVAWTPLPRTQVLERLRAHKGEHAARSVAGAGLFDLPGRLWVALVHHAGVVEGLQWGRLSNAQMETLADELVAGRYAVGGKSMFKDEFVTCGGVRLSEVDFKTMESKLCPGLHFAGEVLDIDAVTGGFNFQAAWTSGWIAGCAMAGADA